MSSACSRSYTASMTASGLRRLLFRRCCGERNDQFVVGHVGDRVGGRTALGVAAFAGGRVPRV
jgi:hypothetical protein